MITNVVPDRWPNQEEAFQFAMKHPACMLDMDMGTGKTKVAIDVMFARTDVRTVLVLCPKAVMELDVWSNEIKKHAGSKPKSVFSFRGCKGNTKSKSEQLWRWYKYNTARKVIIIMNYDIAWRTPMGDLLRKLAPDMIILDESHRAKAAGSKISKYLHMLGKGTKYKMCLSGTPMAHSPLDVYGQYRFLNNRIFGTRYDRFQGEYAIMGGPEGNFVVGFKNQKRLREKFQSIAYTCKMADIRDRIKLPEHLPPVVRLVDLPRTDMVMSQQLAKEFIAECGDGHTIVLNNVLNKVLRLQQIAAGYCMAQSDPLAPKEEVELNTSKQDELTELLLDVSPLESVVVFCVFKHDIRSVKLACEKARRQCFELSGDANTYHKWSDNPGAVIAVQIQAGAEGISMVQSHICVYFTLPYSLALYNQSMARVYRPGQQEKCVFIHLVAQGTIDEVMYNTLINRRDLIEDIKNGTVDFGYIKSKR